MKIHLFPAPFLLATVLVLSGCSFEKIGRDAGKGLGSSLSPAADSIGANLVNAIRKSLTNDSSRMEIQRFVDSILHPAFYGIQGTAGSLRDSFVNARTLIWADSLMQSLTGRKLNDNLVVLQASVLGKTKLDILEMERSLQLTVAAILSRALGDSTRASLALLRDELLGPKTGTALNRIIDTAVTHVVDTALVRLSRNLRSDIDPFFKDNISFVRRNAVWLLVALAVLAAGIIVLVWLNRQKYLRMVAMLTKQIHDIPNQEVYDYVTAKIKNEAVTAGLEPTLRSVLKDNGLLGSEAWKKNT